MSQPIQEFSLFNPTDRIEVFHDGTWQKGVVDQISPVGMNIRMNNPVTHQDQIWFIPKIHFHFVRREGEEFPSYPPQPTLHPDAVDVIAEALYDWENTVRSIRARSSGYQEDNVRKASREFAQKIVNALSKEK